MPEENEESNTGLLERQASNLIDWANFKSRRNRAAYIGFKLVQLLVAASIPVAAAAEASSVVVAVIGAVVILLQGADQLLQWGRRYLVVAEARDELDGERFLWRSRAGAYAENENPDRLFAERLAQIDSRLGTQMRELTRQAMDTNRETSPGA